MRAIVDFSFTYGDNDWTQVRKLLLYGEDLAEKSGLVQEAAIAQLTRLFYESITGNIGEQGHLLDVGQIHVLIEKLKNHPEYEALAKNILSYHYWFSGDYEKGFNLSLIHI